MSVFEREVIQRGYDSLGRPLRNTRLKWAAFDRINGRMGGQLVIVQGAFMDSSGADASAGTHEFAGCNDVRRWNLTSAQARDVIEIANEVGDIWWERTPAQGFDPHFHNLLPNDYPLHPDAADQVVKFRRGENGLANRGRDTHHRPTPFPTFVFEEDDMFEDKDRQLLNDILERVDKGFTAEWSRDQADRKKEQQRHKTLVQNMAGQVDSLGRMLNMLKDDKSPTADEIRTMLRQSRNQLLRLLKDDPTTTGTPNDPSEEALDG